MIDGAARVRPTTAVMETIYRHPGLRGLYWLVRSPFSPYASYRWAIENLAAHIFKDRRVGVGYRVVTGPFAGMIHTRSGAGTNLPCILGIYEHEIHAWVEEVVRAGYARVIDIGCAEGYYANGLALRTRRSVVACDVSSQARANCREMARLNRVEDLVAVREGLTHQSLEALLRQDGRSFVLCDIEGSERSLLDPDLVPSLKQTDMIVEIHGNLLEDTLSTLQHRFAATHSFRIAEFSPVGLGWLTGELADFMVSLYPQYAESLILALTEPRGYSRWAFAKRRD